MNLPFQRDRKRVVLLGIGHTNAHVVKEWAHAALPNCDLVCISKFPIATYSGMLPGTLGRQFPVEEMQIDLVELTRRAGAELILADASGLDLNAGTVQFADREPLRFDLLSIGVGSMPKGWHEHSHSPLLVPIKPMQTFLQRLDAHLLEASNKRSTTYQIAIVGGGVASVEIAFCLQSRLQQRGLHDETQITIITSSPHVGDGMTHRSVRRIEQLLAVRGIEVYPNQRVESVGKDSIVAQGGETYPANCVVWATGAAAPPILAKLGLQCDDRGFVATSRTLQSLSDPRIFAVGDSGTVVESPFPKAGVYAVRQCPILWHNLRALVDGLPLEKFQPQSDFLKLLNTGDGRTLLEYGRLTLHARWCWHLKTWIDKRFVKQFS